MVETASSVLASLHGARRIVRRARWLGLHVVATGLIAGCGAARDAKVPSVEHHAGPETMFTGASTADYTPAVLAQLKALGVDRIHIYMHWADIAPEPGSLRRPAFDASDPAAYQPVGWAPYDAAIRALGKLNIGVDLDLVAPPPDWAEGTGAPRPHEHPYWKPNAGEFGQFVHAVATRYDGRYTPAGATSPLPRVGFWSIWNEPDLGTQIAPEAVDDHEVEVAPRYYRAIVDAMWSELQATGHGHDTILIGEIAPAGVRSGVGEFNQMQPLRFLRALYCVNAGYQPLRATAATERGCPATAAGSAGFAAANPGLFHASGFADHPYSQGLPPDEPTPDEPDYSELAAIPKLESTLDRLQGVYRSTTRFPIWSTEFGYQTTPPDTEEGTVSPQTAVYYLNWSEYLTWLDPRIKSYDQYLLTDPPDGSFASGLETAAGAPKPGYYAFRMPLYLPVTTASAAQALDVWGCVRPAPNAARASHRRQSVQIQFSSGGGFRTVAAIPITDRYGYFEVRQHFPGSGRLRLAWDPSHGATEYSRIVDITLS